MQLLCYMEQIVFSFHEFPFISIIPFPWTLVHSVRGSIVHGVVVVVVVVVGPLNDDTAARCCCTGYHHLHDNSRLLPREKQEIRVVHSNSPKSSTKSNAHAAMQQRRRHWMPCHTAASNSRLLVDAADKR